MLSDEEVWATPTKTMPEEEEEEEEVWATPPSRLGREIGRHEGPITEFPRGEQIEALPGYVHPYSLYNVLAAQIAGLQQHEFLHVVERKLLRIEIVQHLYLNPDRYWDLLLRSIEMNAHRYAALPTDEEKVEQYIDDLERPQFPPGDEVIQAAADLYKVNVVVFPERGEAVVFMSDDPDVGEYVALKRQLVEWDNGFRWYNYSNVDRLSPTAEPWPFLPPYAGPDLTPRARYIPSRPYHRRLNKTLM